MTQASIRVAEMTPQTIGLVARVRWLLSELGWFGLELSVQRQPDFAWSRQTWKELPQPTPQQLEAARSAVAPLLHVPGVRCYGRVRLNCSPFRWVPPLKWGVSTLTREGVTCRDGVSFCNWLKQYAPVAA